VQGVHEVIVMTMQPGSDPAPSDANKSPEPQRPTRDVAEAIIGGTVAVVCVYLMMPPTPPDRPFWQSLLIFCIFLAGSSRVVQYFSAGRKKQKS
jgi:hypothetical protein